MMLLDTIKKLLLLGAMAFLGFYVFGLVMGVFSPGEMISFTLLAVAFAILGAVHLVRVRRAMSGPERERIVHELQKYHERRGF
jgi:membrane protein implicated in regulation of membrane protease activity